MSDTAAGILHDLDCDDGTTESCGRWLAGSDVNSPYYSSHFGHVRFYEIRAEAVRPVIRAEEREACARLAEEHHASYAVPCKDGADCAGHLVGAGHTHHQLLFADFLRGRP